MIESVNHNPDSMGDNISFSVLYVSIVSRPLALPEAALKIPKSKVRLFLNVFIQSD